MFPEHKGQDAHASRPVFCLFTQPRLDFVVSMAIQAINLYLDVFNYRRLESWKEGMMRTNMSLTWRPAFLLALGALLVVMAWNGPANGWPAASLESRDANCTACHSAAGTWADTSKLVIDIIDPKTGQSFRTPDGSFEIPVQRGSERRVKSVFGVTPGHRFPPDMAGWLYVSPDVLETAHESDMKFAPGWQVNRPFCGKRLVESVEGYPGDKLAAITMTIRPLENAKDAAVSLQVLLKSFARGLDGDYFERVVRLRVTE
jgi:hypothetical protein